MAYPKSDSAKVGNYNHESQENLPVEENHDFLLNFIVDPSHLKNISPGIVGYYSGQTGMREIHAQNARAMISSKLQRSKGTFGYNAVNWGVNASGIEGLMK